MTLEVTVTWTSDIWIPYATVEMVVLPKIKVLGTALVAARGDGLGGEAAAGGMTPLGASTLLEPSPDFTLICWSSDLLIEVSLKSV